MSKDLIERFTSRYTFGLDEFQIGAIDALAAGESVLVAAPTGSGKTVVGEFAVWLALQQGGKAFYTTPLKALSNQKFSDLGKLYGSEKVGLLTGDNSINATAPAVVMTTEVLRNMIYERSELLKDLRYVVLDEVHYLQDRYRGAVWEEVIIHLPLDVDIVSLSATVSNAEEFAEWIQTLRGTTKAIIEERRPVQLQHHYLIDNSLYPMFVDHDGQLVPNHQIQMLEERRVARATRKPRSRSARPPRRFPYRSDVVEVLAGRGMLPAIYFIFSRKGCNAAVTQCLRDGLTLTDGSERKTIRAYAQERCSYLDSADLDVLGYDEWLDALVSGLAAHHAGMIPAFKETVEELFQQGLVKVVFATETLSLGINMPARTVIIESLTKFTGERHEMLTAGQFTQFTGRAGRRGIDVAGHAVVPRQPEIPFSQIAGLAQARTYPLVSSFQPSYNMATNLIRNYTRDEAEHLLNSSFAQYRADRDVVVLEKLLERNDAYLASYREKMRCTKGDFSEYWALRDAVAALEKSHARDRATRTRERTRAVISGLRPGEVLESPSAKFRGPLVILGLDRVSRSDPRVVVLTVTGRTVRLGMADFPRPPKRIGTLGGHDYGSGKRKIDHRIRNRLVASLKLIATELPDHAPELDEPAGGLHQAQAAVLRHPCHSCPDRDRHSQWAERAARLQRENDGLRTRVRGRTDTLSLKFERILGVLERFDCVQGFNLTAKGWTLAAIYNENDLLVTEALERGWLQTLDVAELAAISSAFVFESRGPFPIVGRMPTASSKNAYGKISRLAERIRAHEREAGLELTRGIEAGFGEKAFRWVRGELLEDVVDEDTTAGDFIRSCKQTIDLLKQLAGATSNAELAAKLRTAVEQMNRGVVAYTGLL